MLSHASKSTHAGAAAIATAHRDLIGVTPAEYEAARQKYAAAARDRLIGEKATSRVRWKRKNPVGPVRAATEINYAPARRGPRGYPVIAILPDGTEERYESVVHAAQALRTQHSTIYGVLTGRHKICAGRRWRKA